MMTQLVDFLNANAALLVAALALIISLRASSIAHSAHNLNLRSKSDSDRTSLAEKRKELLNAIDRQHTALASLNFVTSQQILIFAECPKLNELLPTELGRLKSNLATVETLEASYETIRNSASTLSDIPSHDEKLAEIMRLTVHLDKDIAHERTLLEQLPQLAATAPAPSA
jgi:hypothetical protein